MKYAFSDRNILVALILLTLSSSTAWGAFDWQQQNSISSPADRLGHTMAWDGQRVILFGGLANSRGNLSNETWAWDGSQWTQLFPVHSPSARAYQGMVYDGAHNQVVLFGGSASGNLADTWLWSGSDWTNAAPANSPSARFRPRMGYDPSLLQVILYGGEGSSPLNDLWVWNGSTWTQQAPSPAFPAGRYNPPVMSYDPLRQGFVLFGGLQTANGILYSDTWLLSSGSEFTQLTPAAQPSARADDNNFALDSVRNLSVLFGGDGGSASTTFALSDTWQWDGSNWTQQSPATVPPGRNEHAMAYDPVHRRMVMFGGQGANNVTFSDTWVYHDLSPTTENWTQLSPATSPSARAFHSMAYDPVHQQVVLFGGCAILSSGCDSGAGGETWLWDGANWTRAATNGPASRRFANMAWDPVRQRVLLFGGSGETGSPYYTDTWLWDGTSWTQLVTPASPTPVANDGINLSFMAYDSNSQQMVLVVHGNYFNGVAIRPQTWTLDSSNTWSEPSVAHPTFNLDGGGMVFDPIRNQMVFVSLDMLVSGGPRYSDTYLYTQSPADWVLQNPAHFPPPTWGTPYAWDGTAGQVLSFGGSHAGDGLPATLPDTWGWNGTDWTHWYPLVSPPARTYAAMAYDGARRQVVLFGGNDSGSAQLADTWVWGTAAVATTPVAITVPAGVQFTFSGTTYSGAQTINIAPGTYTLSTPSSQFPSMGTQAIFTSWSDGGAQSHTVTVDAAAVNITGSYQTQYLLTAVADPGPAGTVSQSGGGSNGPWYNAGILVNVTQRAAANFAFATWSGACSGSGACSVTMNSPATVTANFTSTIFLVTINVPAGVQYTLGAMALPGTQSVPLSAGIHALTLASPQGTAPGTQLIFTSWSDGGAQSHNITVVASPVTVTGTFKTQYLLTEIVSPAGGGTVSPGGGYYDAGTLLNPVASANAGFQFTNWSGASSGSNPSCVVSMSAPMTLTANFATPPKWVPVFPASSPSGRLNSTMAYDSSRGMTVMFGGGDSDLPLNDTWEWDGTTWNLRTPAVSPAARWYGALAYDPIHHQTVLFGGLTAQDVRLADTWVWDGTNWSQKPTGPSPRSSARMVFDAARDQILLFGGATSDTTVAGDTWSWNGASWTQIVPAVSPSARGGHGMVYDEARQQVLLFGGQSGDGSFYGDTWVWNGAWTKQSPLNSPAPRSHMAIAFDGALQQVALFAGYGVGDFSNVTWFWDGANWTQKTYAICPTDRNYMAAAYDSARQQMVLFGGYGLGLPDTDVFLNDTWIFSNNLNPPQYSLAIAANPAAGGTVSQFAPGQPSPIYYAGTPVLVSATPNAGYELQSWTGGCAGAGPCIATMNANNSVTANFGAQRTWSELFPATSPTNPTNGDETGGMVFDKARMQTVFVDGGSNTWTFDGSNWTLRNPLTPIGLGVSPFRLAYDEVTGQVVACGDNISETWTWDGTTWTQRFPANHPSTRDAFGIAFDAAIGKVVLFGGENEAFSLLSDTWLWDGAAGTWTQVVTAHTPTARTAPAMVYDRVHQVVVLFGGLTISGGGVASSLNDTWVFNGTDWVQQAPAKAPSPRYALGATWDDVRQQMVTFGGTTGVSGSSFLAETWVWDGSTWIQKTPSLSPSARFGPAMAYDGVRQQPIVLGGFGQNGDFLKDTWEYGDPAAAASFTLTTQVTGSGTVARAASGQPGPSYLAGTSVTVTATPAAGSEFQYWSGACSGSVPICTVVMSGNLTAIANFNVPEQWVERFPATSPTPTPGTYTQNMSMAFDEARQQIVLFGGPYGGAQYGNQTWVWDGATWTQKIPVTIPPARFAAQLAYDPLHREVVMFAGAAAGGPLADTWVWDGANWTQEATGATAPPARINHGMAFDGQQIVMFGGWDENATIFSDTWLWNGSAWTKASPANHPTARSDFGMAYDALHGQVVLFSSYDAGAADTWLWNGASSTWTQAAPATNPPAGWNAMAYL